MEKETGRQTNGKRGKVKTSSRFTALCSRLHGVGRGDGGKQVVCVSLLWKKEELSSWIYIIQPAPEQHFQQRQTPGVTRQCLFLSSHVESSPSLVTVKLAWGGWDHVTVLLGSLPYRKGPSFGWVLHFVMVFSESRTMVPQLRRGFVPTYAERGASPGSYAETILWPAAWGAEGTSEIVAVSLTCLQWQPVYCSFLL